jgi:hypothetical protein
MAGPKTICTEVLERHCAAGDTGRLDFQRDHFVGRIFIYGGFIVHAELAGLEGVPALFRLFDWGDATISWHPEEVSEQSSLNLAMAACCALYAEHLAARASFDQAEQQKLDAAFDTASSSGDAAESALKYYVIRLECGDRSLLPDGFVFSDRSKPSYVIGSSDECDVILRHPSVDPLHCGVILENGKVMVWDLGAQSGVRLNGQPIEQGTLKVGDIMSLGAVDLQVSFNLRRPNIARAATGPLPSVPAVRSGPPPKQIPKGAITYEKVSKSLKGEKGAAFLGKLGSLFGSKDK